MKFVYFTHSIISDWNNGNAHFLRGIVTELVSRGIEVQVYEPHGGWSLCNLKHIYGESAIDEFYDYYPKVNSCFYNSNEIDIDKAIGSADVVIVHEWNEPQLIMSLGNYRKQNSHFSLLFHDTHHRALSQPADIESLDLSGYDGVLAFGESLREIYLKKNIAKRVWTWHEAADTRIFKLIDNEVSKGDVVWIGNWGDEERSTELLEFIFNPVKELKLQCQVYGVRYPQKALTILNECGIKYMGWIPNYKVPRVFSNMRLTIHVPRGPYVKMLHGIPTIRMFEALACGIPLISSQWDDSEGMFIEGRDYLKVTNGTMMKEFMRMVLNDRAFADELGRHGRKTVLKKHTCAHRVDQLLAICNEIKPKK